MGGENSLHGGQVSKDDVHGVNRVGADGFLQVHRLGHAASRQHFVKHVPADQRHKPNGDFKRAVLPTITWQGDIQIHLKRKTSVIVAQWSMIKASSPIKWYLNFGITLKDFSSYSHKICNLDILYQAKMWLFIGQDDTEKKKKRHSNFSVVLPHQWRQEVG